MKRLEWSGKQAPPRIGDAVHVYMNGLGPGIVTGYFEDEGFLGVSVEVKGFGPADVFGIELEPIIETA